MTATYWLVVAVGAAIGAPSRYLMERWVFARTGSTAHAASPWLRLPWGLFVINVLGSTIAGVALAATSGALRMFIVVGLCGAFTTFSGYGWQAHQAWLADRRAFWTGLLAMTMGCIAAFSLTFAATSALVSA